MWCALLGALSRHHLLALADGLQQVRIAGYGPCAHYETRARIPLDGAMMVRAARLSP
jgi:hypothetical protein